MMLLSQTEKKGGWTTMSIYYIAQDQSLSLSHHGILGMKWGVRNAETRAKYAGDGNGGRAEQKSGKTKYKKNKSSIVGKYKYNVGDKTVTKSYWSNRADRKVKKSTYKAVYSPNAASIINQAKWKNKQVFENARDIGRTSGTTAARRIGKAAIVAGIAVVGGGVAAGSAAAIAGAAVLGGGMFTNRMGKKREFKRGYDVQTHRKSIVAN